MRRLFHRLLATCVLAAGLVAAQTTPSPAALSISGDVAKPQSLSLSELRAMPHKTLKVTNPHEHKVEVYEGVPLSDLLKLAGVPQGEQLRGAAMATYVLIEAADGYRVVFSIAELDSGFQDSGVLLADRLDGRPLDDKLGPLRLVAPHDKRPARWVRMTRSIRVVSVPK